VETFSDPKLKFLKGKIGLKRLKIKSGFRYLIDIITLDANLVKSSYYRIKDSEGDWPLFITQHRCERKKTSIWRRIFTN